MRKEFPSQMDLDPSVIITNGWSCAERVQGVCAAGGAQQGAAWLGDSTCKERHNSGLTWEAHDTPAGQKEGKNIRAI